MSQKTNILKLGLSDDIELKKGVCGTAEVTFNGVPFALAVSLDIGEFAILKIVVSPKGECVGVYEEVNISLSTSGEYDVSLFNDEPFHNVTDLSNALTHLVSRKTVLAGVEYVINFAHNDKDLIINLLSRFLEAEQRAAIRKLEADEAAEREEYRLISKSLQLISSELAEHFIKEIQSANDDYDDNNGFHLDLVIPHHGMHFIERATLSKSGGLYFVMQNVEGKCKTRQIELERVIWYIKNTYY